MGFCYGNSLSGTLICWQIIVGCSKEKHFNKTKSVKEIFCIDLLKRKNSIQLEKREQNNTFYPQLYQTALLRAT